jgi:hypothetical protein
MKRHERQRSRPETSGARSSDDGQTVGRRTLVHPPVHRNGGDKSVEVGRIDGIGSRYQVSGVRYQEDM